MKYNAACKMELYAHINFCKKLSEFHYFPFYTFSFYVFFNGEKKMAMEFLKQKPCNFAVIKLRIFDLLDIILFQTLKFKI